MYIVIISVFLIVIILYWSAIQNVINTMIKSNISNGYIWYFILLLINIIGLVILVGYYYYLINKPGNIGMPGNKGFTGVSGDECQFPNTSENNPKCFS